MSKDLTIEISAEDLENLRNSGLALCIAKQVASGNGGGHYSVVWQSTMNFVRRNQLSWTPYYELFAARQALKGHAVWPMFNGQDMGLGQRATLDRSGMFQRPVSGGPATAITMVNDFGPLHPGLSQEIVGFDGAARIAPIYLDPVMRQPGPVTFTPIDVLLVWFEAGIGAGSIFSRDRTQRGAIEVDMTAADTATRLFSNGAWSTP